MLDHQLQPTLTSVFIDIELVHETHVPSARIGPMVKVNVKSNALQAPALMVQLQLEVFFLEQTLVEDLDHALKKGLWEMLAPWPRCLKQLCSLKIKVVRAQLSICLKRCFRGDSSKCTSLQKRVESARSGCS